MFFFPKIGLLESWKRDYCFTLNTQLFRYNKQLLPPIWMTSFQQFADQSKNYCATGKSNSILFLYVSHTGGIDIKIIFLVLTERIIHKNVRWINSKRNVLQHWFLTFAVTVVVDNWKGRRRMWQVMFTSNKEVGLTAAKKSAQNKAK